MIWKIGQEKKINTMRVMFSISYFEKMGLKYRSMLQE